MTRAYLVLGPESSGTRLVTRLLIGAGCYGDGDHEQRLDAEFPADGRTLVWRRSIPHNRQWPSIVDMAARLRSAGYQVTAVVTTRDWYPTIRSQVAAGHVVNDTEASSNLQRAYPYIFEALARWNIPFVVSPYEALTRPEAVRRLLVMLGLPPDIGEAVRDENAKWYE